MTPGAAEHDDVLERAARGDAEAVQQLLARHRDALKRMVAARLDRRVAARIDPSDVVQEALFEAARHLPGYLRDRPVSFYPWLRQIARDRLVKLHHLHLRAGKRSVCREATALPLPDESALQLVALLAAPAAGQSSLLERAELRALVHDALARLDEQDREVLVMRYLEQLSTREVAEGLGISEGAVKMRHLRALERLRPLLDSLAKGDG
jgi:RNA polymerase sigma-70 factor (ECF subfamily)